jgi:hypothetical protein
MKADGGSVNPLDTNNPSISGPDASVETRIVWMKEMATSDGDGSDIAVGGGSLFQATIFAGSVTTEGQTFTTHGQVDTLLTAYTLAGNLRWVKQVGGQWADQYQRIQATTDALIVTGSMGRGVDLGGQLYQPGVPNADFFSIVARYNHAGEVVWWNDTYDWRLSGGTANNAGGEGAFLLVLPSGNYLAGFQGASALFTADGNPAAGSANQFPGDRETACGGLHPDGGLLIAGAIHERTITLMGRPFVTQGFADGFTARFATSGALMWVTTFSGSGDDECFDGVSADARGDVYVVCHSTNEVDIGGKIYGPSVGGFIAKLAGDTGQPLWVKLEGSTSAPVADGDTLLVATWGLGGDSAFGLGTLFGSHLVRLSASTGDGIWANELPGTVRRIVVTSDAIYVGGPKLIARLRP